jgi:hypothetical protein
VDLESGRLSRFYIGMCAKPPRSKVLTRTRVNPPHDQAFFANSNA